MIKHKILIFLFMALLAFSLNAQEKVKLMKQYNFALKTNKYLEGFSKSIGENDFSYHSLRNDVTESLLTRCTNDGMPIEWLTQNVPEDHGNEGAWFVWLAAVDLTNTKQKFDVFVNDIKRFEFLTGNEKERRFENPEGGILEFTTIDLDQHNDGHGYMSLFAPADWITPGTPLKIKIAGEKAGSSSWIIVFKAEDVLSYLRNSVKYETWLNVALSFEGDNSLFSVSAPIVRDGKSYNLKLEKIFTILN